MKATEVTADPAESNGSLLPGLWRDSLHVTCGLTACTPGSAPGPTLGNEYGKTLLPFFTLHAFHRCVLLLRVPHVLLFVCVGHNGKLCRKPMSRWRCHLRVTEPCIRWGVHIVATWQYTKRGKGSPYSITERRVLELILVLGSQPAGDLSHKPGGRLS